MKKQLHILTVIAASLSIFLQACDKNDPVPEPPITYPMEAKAVSLKSQGPVRLFTKNGEVKDEAVIKKFTASELNIFSIELKREAIVAFLNDSTAKFDTADIVYKFKREGNKLLFYHDIVLSIPANQHSGIPDIYKLTKYNEPLKLHPGPFGSLSYVSKELRAAVGNPTSFTLPLLAYKVKRTDGEGPAYTESAISGTIFNEFNDSFLESLTFGDTVAYRQYYVDFKKI